MWLTELTSWLGNALNSIGSLMKTVASFLLTKIYVLMLPGLFLIKLIFDFFRVVINTVVEKLETLNNFSGAISVFPECVSFFNSFFPVDETMIAVSSLVTFYCTCHLIATIRGIKQTALF